MREIFDLGPGEVKMVLWSSFLNIPMIWRHIQGWVMGIHSRYFNMKLRLTFHLILNWNLCFTRAGKKCNTAAQCVRLTTERQYFKEEENSFFQEYKFIIFPRLFDFLMSAWLLRFGNFIGTWKIGFCRQIHRCNKGK